MTKRDLLIIDSVHTGHMITLAHQMRALDALAPAGLINVDGAWKLTAKGLEALNNNPAWWTL